MPARPWIALTSGDPAGIGPEIVTEVLASGAFREHARLLVLGPGFLRPEAAQLLREASPAELDSAGELAWLDTGPDSARWEIGRAQASSGRAALAALRAGAGLAHAGVVSALVCAPVSKEAFHLAGEEVEGQTELLSRWAKTDRVQMLAVAGKLRVGLATRHMPLAQALRKIDAGLVLDQLRLLSSGLARIGLHSPRLALAGLNPHAGEAGLLGKEEDEILEPALAQARDEGIEVAGPVPPDTVFVQASQGRFDAVLALYHDQGFIPVKLLSEERGVTVLLGLPYLRVSPVHGTAFDIAGEGRASATNLAHAIEQAAAWSRAADASPDS
jgi:4-hydroxythreonine-4-phosphate dehydrogenase